jgi:predicted short-subunit dehydrogenase-like oxidoreductase (DUF2520 family)
VPGRNRWPSAAPRRRIGSFEIIGGKGRLRAARYPTGTGAEIFETACVVGAGRAGSAIAARLGERLAVRTVGRDLSCRGEDLVVLCVPDGAIREVAAAVPTGSWVCHVSGALGVDVLLPHERRFSLHPLQTFQSGLGAGQLDGTWAAVSGDTPEALAAANELAQLLRVRPFAVADGDRALYHAAATMASPFLVTLHRIAADLMEAASAPPQALLPLMRRTMENGFRPTGPHVRGDWETVERHLEAIQTRRPELEPVYRALSDATAVVVR